MTNPITLDAFDQASTEASGSIAIWERLGRFLSFDEFKEISQSGRDIPPYAAYAEWYAPFGQHGCFPVRRVIS